MDSCCEDKSCEITALREKHGHVLMVVLFINAGMFLLEGMAGWFANSTSLMADALDMLGDATVYAMSLYVLNQSQKQQAKVALIKGGFMLAFGLFVLADAVYKIYHSGMPNTSTMGTIGTLALAANLVCFYMLYSHREDSLNMSSTWLCSRNDLIANVGVLAAAGFSYLLLSRWPDILVGLSIALLFLKSSWEVTKEALAEIRKPQPIVPQIIQPIGIQIQRRKRPE
ncbi:MAG: cation diffusion facilitator family transporter [Methylophilaceae bacterium]|nr:cation diffusion facilitator family transporter [Methyloradius sp.]